MPAGVVVTKNFRNSMATQKRTAWILQLNILLLVNLHVGRRISEKKAMPWISADPGNEFGSQLGDRIEMSYGGQVPQRRPGGQGSWCKQSNSMVSGLKLIMHKILRSFFKHPVENQQAMYCVIYYIDGT